MSEIALYTIELTDLAGTKRWEEQAILLRDHQALMAKLKAERDALAERPTCRWTKDEDDIWHGSCGVDWEFGDGGPVENRCVYCQRCGGRIEVEALDAPYLPDNYEVTP